jgi:hypothetical protein
VQDAANGPRWVADRNYGFVTIFARALRRTFRRIISREPLFAGNGETMQRAFFSRDSILLWVITTFHRRRRDYASLRKGGEFGGLEWIELRRPAEAEAFLTDAPA